MDAEGLTRKFTDYYDCKVNQDDVSIGKQASIIYGTEGTFVDASNTVDRMKTSSGTSTFLFIAGSVITALALLVIILRLVKRKKLNL